MLIPMKLLLWGTLLKEWNVCKILNTNNLEMNKVIHNYLKKKEAGSKLTTCYLIKKNNSYMLVALSMLRVNFLVISGKAIKVTRLKDVKEPEYNLFISQNFWIDSSAVIDPSSKSVSLSSHLSVRL